MVFGYSASRSPSRTRKRSYPSRFQYPPKPIPKYSYASAYGFKDYTDSSRRPPFPQGMLTKKSLGIDWDILGELLTIDTNKDILAQATCAIEYFQRYYKI